MTDASRDRLRLETLLAVIADIERRLDGMTDMHFAEDRDEVDLTAYRLSVIGENANKLSEGVKARHPEIPWRAMYGFRNLVSHEYVVIVPRFVWAAAQELAAIRDMCTAELSNDDGISSP